MTALGIAIVFESRWRIGTGTTRSGVVDDQTWADARGHLTIPASHLKRRLRERAEVVGHLLGLPVCAGRLAGGQDPEVAGMGVPGDGPAGRRACVDRGEPACITCRIFGSPRVEPGWRFSPGVLELPGGTGAWQQDALRAAERLRVTHNRVDPWARRVAEDLLFSVEAGRPSLSFAATCGYVAGPTAPDDETALLVGSVGALESLGGRTRRGYGRCRAWVVGEPGGRSHDDWIDHLVDGVAP